jgi:predicted metalloprotease with PDZ domain
VTARRSLPLASPITYRIVPVDPHAHLFEVHLTIAEPAPAGQRLALATWIPGSYMIREFARNVVSIGARSGRRRIRLLKLDKCTWQAAATAGPLEIDYRVYAWDLSVRAAHLDGTHGFFNGSSVFLQVIGQERRPCTVDIEPPAGAAFSRWRVATTLPEAGARRHGFGRYRAADYDALLDHPVEMGEFQLAAFDAAGARHEVVVTGRCDVDLQRLCDDLKPVCRVQASLFEPRTRRAPFQRYLFLTMAVGEGYGGLEHRDSTALLCSRNDLPYPGMKEATDGYRTFLGLASHEYFHAWHVKRIKPAAFVPYDLTRENHTRLLWIFEGFTSYYDDLMLVRAGAIDADTYLRQLARTVSGVLRTPGRHLQSVADSSFDAWTKYYRQDENAPNAIVSYYTKGSLVACALDLAVRARTRGRRSLDDAMRLLWQRYGRRFYAADGGPGDTQSGLSEDGFVGLLRDATGVDLAREVAEWAEGTADLPLASLLEPFGVTLSLAPAEGVAALGIRVATRGAELVVTHALADGTGARAGLSAADVLVACDGLRVSESSLKALLTRRRPGERLRLHAFRRDELMEFDVRLDEPARTEVTLRRRPGRHALRLGWLGR